MKGAMKENFFGDIMKFINGSKEPFINLSDYNKKDKLFFFDMSLFLFISNKLNSSFKEKGQDKVEFVSNSPEKNWFKANNINSIHSLIMRLSNFCFLFSQYYFQK